MFWRRLFLFSFLVIAPLSFLGGCGGGVSGPNPMTQAGLGTVVVKVDYDASIVVALDKVTQFARRGRATFYDVSPGKHEITVSSSSGYSSTTVNVIADKTVSVTVSTPDGPPTATPFVTPFGN